MATDGSYRQIKDLKRLFLTADNQARDYLVRGLFVFLIGLALLTTTFVAFRFSAPNANAQALRISSSASCAQLARIDPTVTNGSSWGRTILPGHGAAGGWFGVDVCSNGFNSSSPNGSSVSCDSVSHGCSPTNDGYGWTFQCPELVVRFSAWAFGDKPSKWGRSGWGNAPDLWLPVNHPSDFVMYPNGSSTPPVPGDILIWGFLDGNGNPWPAGPDGSHGGHIAVVAAVRGGMVITAEQNVKWGSQDHPTDKLALTKSGSRWILSGTSQHTTTLPTWRWLRTMGHSRGTFGWLHSVKNNGRIPNTHAATTITTAQKPTNSNTLSQQFPGGLPSLSSATVVTSSGTLADLTWSPQSFFTPSADQGQPQAQVRSLGVPSGTIRLASGQSASTLLLSNGSRYTYVLGTDGNIYVARTSLSSLGVFWSGLGQPPGIGLTGSPVASLFAGGVQVVARGSDGNLWWRAGPPDRLGDWFSLGSPSASPLSDNMALAGVPGAGSPIVFVLGTDGRIYMRIWEEAITAADGSQIPAAWSDWLTLGAQSSTSHLAGSLLVVPEIPTAHNWIGPWPDSPLNIFATDSVGALWWFRSTRLSNGWTATSVEASPAPLSAVLGGVAVPPSPGGATSSAPANTVQVYVSARSTSYMCTVTLPGASATSATKPSWLTLPDPPAGLATTMLSTAVALGPGKSVLVASAGDEVVIGGSQTMTSALLSAASAQALNGAHNTNPWMRVGVVPVAATFSDSFTSTHLDSRWTRSDATARASLDGKGLVLVPGAHDVAALTQTATEGDVTLTVKIARPGTLPKTGSVGLILYQDDSDWLTLMVDHTGTLRLCPMVQQVTKTCLTGKANASAPVWLRIQRTGSVFTAFVSADGTTWQNVGQWTPAMSNSALPEQTETATPSSSPTSTPVVTATAEATALANSTPSANVPSATDPAAAPLAFTSWGVLAVGDGHATGWSRVTDFTVTPTQ